jgi:hypothetical protein
MEIAGGNIKKITLCGTALFLLILCATVIFFRSRGTLIGLSGSFVVSQINLLILTKIVRRLTEPKGNFAFTFLIILSKFLLIILSIATLFHFFDANPVAMAVGFSLPVVAICATGFRQRSMKR